MKSTILKEGASQRLITYYDQPPGVSCPTLFFEIIPQYNINSGTESITLNKNTIAGTASDIIQYSLNEGSTWLTGTTLSQCVFLKYLKIRPYFEKVGSVVTVGIRAIDITKCPDINASGFVIAKYQNNTITNNSTLFLTEGGNATFWNSKGNSVVYSAPFDVLGTVFEKQIKYTVKPTLEIEVAESINLRQWRSVLIKRTIIHSVCGTIVKIGRLECDDPFNITPTLKFKWL